MLLSLPVNLCLLICMAMKALVYPSYIKLWRLAVLFLKSSLPAFLATCTSGMSIDLQLGMVLKRRVTPEGGH